MTFLTFMRDFGSLIFTMLIIVFYVVLLIVRLSQRRKGGDKITIATLYEEIPKLVATAEKTISGKGMGDAKLNSVLTQLRLDAIDSGVKLDLEKATNLINNIVEASKIVNVGKTIGDLAMPIDGDETIN